MSYVTTHFNHKWMYDIGIYISFKKIIYDYIYDHFLVLYTIDDYLIT
jgi:hypothetical protein